MDENVKFWIDLDCAERFGMLNGGACIQVTFLIRFAFVFFCMSLCVYTFVERYNFMLFCVFFLFFFSGPSY